MDEIEEPQDRLDAWNAEIIIGRKLDIKKLKQSSEKCGAQLIVDATASIELQDEHDLAGVISYNS